MNGYFFCKLKKKNANERARLAEKYFSVYIVVAKNIYINWQHLVEPFNSILIMRQMIHRQNARFFTRTARKQINKFFAVPTASDNDIFLEFVSINSTTSMLHIRELWDGEFLEGSEYDFHIKSIYTIPFFVYRFEFMIVSTIRVASLFFFLTEQIPIAKS